MADRPADAVAGDASPARRARASWSCSVAASTRSRSSARDTAGVVAAFSHADMIKAMLAHYLGMHLDLFQRIHVETASVSAIAFYGGFPRVLRMGDTGNYEVLNPPSRERKK